MAEPLRQDQFIESVSPTDLRQFFDNKINASLDKLYDMSPDQNTWHNLKEGLNYMSRLSQAMQQSEGETVGQFTRRLGWGVQAAAIELAGEENLKQHPIRIEWKNDLAQEILAARETSPNHSLPGMTIRFREPYKGHLDEYSHNRIIATFDGVLGANKYALELHVGTKYHEQLEMVGEERLMRQLKGYEPLNSNAILWASSLLNEISMLMNISGKNKFSYIKRRLSSLFQLVGESDEAKEHLRMHHTLTNGYHAFELQMEKWDGKPFSTVIHIQPEEVTDSIWDTFRHLYLQRHPDEIIPSRDLCKVSRRGLRSDAIDEITTLEDDSSGQKKGKNWLRKSRHY